MDSSAATPETSASRAPLTSILLGVVFVVAVVFISQAGWSSSWYAAFKAVHVLAAVVWIGGAPCSRSSASTPSAGGTTRTSRSSRVRRPGSATASSPPPASSSSQWASR
jgi:hypothetical protein